MTRLEASMKDLDLDELHDLILESLYLATRHHAEHLRNNARSVGIVAIQELYSRAKDVTKETK